MSESASLELLKEWIGEEKVNAELVEGKKLCLHLGYLPLALNLVGRYVKKRKISLVEMLRRLEKKGLRHPALDVDEKDRTRTLNIQRGVDTALELSWKELSEDAQKLGCLLSLFALAPIPWWLVEKVKIGLEKEDLEQAREELEDFSLLQGKEIYKLHQLIRDFLKNKLENFSKSNKYKNSFSKAMIAEGEKIDPQNLGKYIFVIPHVLVAKTSQKQNFWLIILFTLLGGIIIVIIIYFLNPWNILGKTTKEEENKLKSQQLATQAKEGSLDRRLLLSATAYKIYPTKEAVKSVFEAWHSSQNLITYLRDEGTQIIKGLMFTDNTKTLISVSTSTIDSASGKISFWDIKNHQNTFLKYNNTLTAIAFNEKAGIIALGDYKGGVTIVDAE